MATVLVVPLPEPDPGAPLQGVPGVEGPAEDTVGGGAEGDWEVEEPVEDLSVRDRQAARDLQERQETWNHQNDTEFLGPQREVHLASRDEITESTQQRYLTRFVPQQGKRGRYPAPKEGDLVLLRRAALDNRYDKKLEARWEGPVHLGDTAHHGRSRRLHDLATGRLEKTKQAGLKDRIHLDDLRVYVSRDRSSEEEVASVGMIKCEKLEWKGDKAEKWRKIGSRESVGLVSLMETEVQICGVG